VIYFEHCRNKEGGSYPAFLYVKRPDPAGFQNLPGLSTMEGVAAVDFARRIC